MKLREGLVAEAGELLGHDYTLTGTVAQGKHKGRGLGFPTPKYGVYTCLLETESDTLPAVANIGVQPTIPSGRVTVEAHILEDCPELYGQKVRLTPLTMLREERKFDSPEALKKQIEKDTKEALKLFDMA